MSVLPQKEPKEFISNKSGLQKQGKVNPYRGKEVTKETAVSRTVLRKVLQIPLMGAKLSKLEIWILYYS